MPAKTVCVVGAGQSGLVSVKESLAQGLKPTCYELESDLGGVWNPRDASTPSNVPHVWSSFITNTSKWSNSFSDFPPIDSHAPIQTQQQLHDYYQKYAVHFNLGQCIHFNTRVIWIRKTSDHETSGRWEVFTCPTAEFRNGNKSALTPDEKLSDDERERVLSKCKKETFDNVIVSSGYFKYPEYLDIEMSSFKGAIHHAFSYTSNKFYENKNVLVVGNRYSALDMAEDVSAVSKQTYLAVGNGTWIIPRVQPGGSTIDQIVTRDLLNGSDTRKKWNDAIVSIAQARIDHVAIGIAPKLEPAFCPVAYGDGIAVKLMSGKVKAYGHLTKLTSTNEAHFDDGSVVTDLDVVLFCTGFGTDLSFLDGDIMAPNGKMELYKMTFPVREPRSTIAFVGILSCSSQMAIVAEMQARLATLTMSGKHALPSHDVMQKDADHWLEINWPRKRSYKYFLPGTMVMDEIAKVLGVYPEQSEILTKDSLLAHRVWHGPIVGAHYRLIGPDNQWEEARKFCHRQFEERAKCVRYMKTPLTVPSYMSYGGNV